MVKNFKKIMACLLAFAVIFTCIGSALATVSAETTAIVTNANGKATDVGIWYTTYNCNEYFALRFANENAKTVGYKALLPDGSYGVPFSGNTDIIDFHIKEMADAGIDFILLDLTNGGLTSEVPYGWKDDSSYAENRWIVEYAKLTAERISKWNDSHAWKIRYAVSVGTYKEVCGDLSMAETAERQAKAVKEIFLNNEDYGDDYYTFNGKPLITLYSWANSFTDLGLDYLIQKNELNKYIADETKALSQFAVRHSGTGDKGQYNWYNKDGMPIYDSEVVTVAPGQSLQDGTINVSRKNGETYEKAWDVVLEAESTPRVVLLSSFNDYMENTALFVTDTNDCLEANGEEKWTNANGDVDNYLYWDKTIECIEKLREKDNDSTTVDTGFINVAAGATVTAVIGTQLESNDLSRATDGANDVNNTSDDAILSYDSSNNLACYEVDLGAEKTINNVTLKLSREVAHQRPRDIAVDVYVDNAWLRVAEIHAAADENIWQVQGDNTGLVNVVYFNFAPVECTKFRVTGNRAGTRIYNNNPNAGYNFRVGEIEAYNNNTITEADYTGIATATVAGTEIAKYKSINVAAGATVTAVIGTQLESNYLSRATDGKYDVNNTSDDAIISYATNNLASYEVDLGAKKTINNVTLKLSREVAHQRPRDIAVDVYVDGTWLRVAEIHAAADENIWQLQGDNTGLVNDISFNFAPVKCTKFRVTGNRAGTRIYNNNLTAGYNFRVDEIEAYNNNTITEDQYTGIATATVAGTEIEGIRSDNYALAANGAEITSNLAGKVSKGYDLIIDGKTNNYGGAEVGNAGTSTIYYQIDFEGTKNINQVVLTLQIDDTNKKKLCLDYAVDVLLENGQWQRTAGVHYTYDQIAIGKKVELNFAPVNGSAIRVSTTMKGQNQVLTGSTESSRYFFMGEIEAYYNSAVYAGNYTGIHAGGNVTVTNASGNEVTYDSTIKAYVSENYALTATVTANAENLATKPLANINNGNRSAGGDRSLTYANQNSDDQAQITFEWNKAITINNIDLYSDGEEWANYGFKDLAIDVLLEDGTVLRVAELHDVNITKNAQLVHVYFAPVTTKKVVITVDATNQGKNTYASFTEVEMYHASMTGEYTGIQEASEGAEIANLPSNFALGQKVTTSNTNWSNYAGNYPADRLTDGITASGPQENCAISNYTDGLASFTVNYDKAYTINKVVVRLSANENLKRPDEYLVDVLTADGWVRVGIQAKPAVNVNSITFYFEAIECTAVRITGNAKYNREVNASGSTERSPNFRINEIETYFDNSVTDEMYTGTKSDLEAKYTANIQGDVDGNTWVNALDLAYALNWYTRARERVESNEAIMDTNRDGKYDIRDYLKVKEILAERDFTLMD